MKRTLFCLASILMLGLTLNGWSEPTKDNVPGIRLEFDVKATMQDRVVHSRPTVLVNDKQEATITLESDQEDPFYRVELRSVPTLKTNGSVELANDLTVVTARGEWHRRLRFSTLLDTDAEFNFSDDDGVEVNFGVRPSLMERH